MLIMEKPATKIYDLDHFEEAAPLLRDGHLVAFPTETVYGLGASVFDEAAIRRIFEVKGRPADNPLIVHLSALEQVDLVARDIPKDFYVLAQAFFPGPLTVVLKRRPSVPSCVSAGLDSVAVRVPRHPIARALIALVGAPLVAPSANLSGKPSATQACHVLEDFDGRIAAVIDGGECSIGIESTVISLLEETPVLLRPGAITQKQLEQVLGKEIAICTHAEQPLSPGMKYRHYAPKAPLKLFDCEKEMERYLHSEPSKKRFVLTQLSSKTLYAMLRLSDAEAVEEVVVFCDAATRSDEALMNRIKRAGGL
jgi:L-threonylcarbamoyladenylate synthase